MMMSSTLFKTNTLSWILQSQLTETTVRGQKCRSTWTYYSEFESTSLCSVSLMLGAYKRKPEHNSKPRSTAPQMGFLTIMPPTRFLLRINIVLYVCFYTLKPIFGMSDGLAIKWAVFHIQSNLSMQSPVLRCHL